MTDHTYLIVSAPAVAKDEVMKAFHRQISGDMLPPNRDPNIIEDQVVALGVDEESEGNSEVSLYDQPKNGDDDDFQVEDETDAQAYQAKNLNMQRLAPPLL